MIKARLSRLFPLLAFVLLTVFQREAQADDVTIRAFEVRDGQYIPVSGEITGTNSVMLFFSASVQPDSSALFITAPLQPTPRGGSPGGASIQVFDSGTVTVSLYTNAWGLIVPGPGDVPVATTNFTVKLQDPLVLSLSIQDRVGKRDFTGTNNLVEAVDFSEIGLSSKYTGGVIYYTTDGSEPNVLSRRYTAPVKVTADTDFRAIAYNGDFSQSQQRRAQVHLVPSVYLRIVNSQNVSVEALDRPEAQLVYGTITVPSNSVVRLRSTNPPCCTEFTGWIGFTNSTNSQIEFVLNRNREIVQGVRNTNQEPIQIELSGNGKVIQGEKFTAFISSFPPSGMFSTEFRQITAVPDPGYFFVGYQNSTAAISYPQALTYAQVHPLFAPLPQGYHSLVLEGEGLVTFSPLEHYAFADGAEVTVTAAAQPGFIFSGWSGDASGTNATVRIKMDRDKRLVAHARQIYLQSYGGSASPVAVGDSGLIYGMSYGVLRAFNSLGTAEWEVPFAPLVPATPGNSAPPELTYPVVGKGERIYVGSETATWAVDKTGRILWQASAGALRIATSSNGVFILSAFGDLARLSFNGAVLARTNLNAYIRAFAITPEGHLLVSGEYGTNSILRAFNDSFQELWRYGTVAPQSLVVRKDGLILAGGFQTDLLDPAGKILWSKTNGEPFNQYTLAAAASTNLFYVYTFDRPSQAVNLSAFAEDGSLRWSRFASTWSGPSGASAVALADGSVISASTGPAITTLKRFGPEGETLWETAAPFYQFSFVQYPPWSTPSIVADPKGNLYLSAGQIYVFGIDGAPANSGWPMWFGDWRNTGQSEPLPGTVVPSELGLFLTVGFDDFELFVSAPPEARWTLQSSTNLIDWADLPTQTNTFNIPLLSPGKNQFFRVLTK